MRGIDHPEVADLAAVSAAVARLRDSKGSAGPHLRCVEAAAKYLGNALQNPTMGKVRRAAYPFSLCCFVLRHWGHPSSIINVFGVLHYGSCACRQYFLFISLYVYAPYLFVLWIAFYKAYATHHHTAARRKWSTCCSLDQTANAKCAISAHLQTACRTSNQVCLDAAPTTSSFATKAFSK